MLVLSAVSLHVLPMCSYGYDSLPVERRGAAGGASFAGMAQGGNLSSGGALGQSGGAGGTVASLGGQPASGGMMVGVGGTGASTGGVTSGGTGGVTSGGTGGMASGGTGGMASGGTGGMASGGTGGVASGGTSSVVNGLVGHWKLDEPNIDGVALDSSGNGNHGTYKNTQPLVSTATPPGIRFSNPYCLDFRGGDIEIPNSANYAWTNTSSFSFSVWTYVVADGESRWRAVLVNEPPDGSPADACGLWMTPSNEWIFGPATARGAVFPAALGWHHIAAVQDGKARIRRIYVDGVLSANTDAALNCSNLNPYRIGGSGAFGNEPFIGPIDDVRMYNRALSDAEVAILAAGN